PAPEPSPAARPWDAATARPGPPRSPAPASPNFADFKLDSVSNLAAGTQRVPEPAGRDAVLELELDGLATGPISAPETAPGDPALRAMKDRYAMGDFTGALVIAEGILEANPENPEVPRYAQSC